MLSPCGLHRAWSCRSLLENRDLSEPSAVAVATRALCLPPTASPPHLSPPLPSLLYGATSDILLLTSSFASIGSTTIRTVSQNRILPILPVGTIQEVIAHEIVQNIDCGADVRDFGSSLAPVVCETKFDRVCLKEPLSQRNDSVISLSLCAFHFTSLACAHALHSEGSAIR